MSFDPNAFQHWDASLPIPWLVAGPNGQAEAATWPSVLDGQITLLRAARNVAYPDFAPVDALSHLGGDRKLIQGGNEANVSFQTRLKDVWAQWSRAGTALGVLEQLAYYGFGSSLYWVQQNGLAYNLSAAPTAGQDPSGLLVTTTLPGLANTLTSSVNPTRTIPAGTPWWFFDGNTDLCNRFGLITSSWPFSAMSTAIFANTDTATVTWPFTFANTTYGVIIGAPSDGVTLTASSPTTTGVTINASAPWSGTVYVIGYASGVNPLNVWTTASPGQVKSIITNFRPNALCTGLWSLLSGRFWGWPTTVKWGDGGTWGGTTSTIISGTF